MLAALALLGVQGVLGAYDNFRNHEFREGLPLRGRQRRELFLHAAREVFYLVLFPTMGWLEWRGWLAYALAAIIVCEIIVTCWDFVEEDRTRRLSANERVLHTILTLNYGAVLALFAPELIAWSKLPVEVVFVDRGYWSWLMTIYSLGVLVFGLRELSAGIALSRDRHPVSGSLHARIVARAGVQLPQDFARFYAGPRRAASGTANVTTGGPLARLLLAIIGLSMKDGAQFIGATFDADGAGELWRREFDSGLFTSRMDARPDKKIGVVERFGPFTFHFDWDVGTKQIDWKLHRAFVFGVPLWQPFVPDISAREWFSEAGKYEMSATIGLPAIGHVLTYSAMLERRSIKMPAPEPLIGQEVAA